MVNLHDLYIWSIKLKILLLAWTGDLCWFINNNVIWAEHVLLIWIDFNMIQLISINWRTSGVKQQKDGDVQ